jgi:transposase
MEMTQPPLGQEAMHQLQHDRDHQRDGRLKIRFLGLFMLAEKIDMTPAAFLIGRSVNRWTHGGHQDLPNGLDGLHAFHDQPKKPWLKAAQCEQLVAWVKSTKPVQTKQVRASLPEQFRGTSPGEAVRQRLHTPGLTIWRPTPQPGNPPSEEAPRAFVRQYETRQGPRAPGTVWLVGDAMHLIHHNEPGSCWGDPKAPPGIQTNRGRPRLHLGGASHPAADSVMPVTGEETGHAQRGIAFWETGEQAYLSAPTIGLFVENANDFKATIVADGLPPPPRLQWSPLPTDAPHVNVIERFWKFVKEHRVKNTYDEPYQTFRAHVFRVWNHWEVDVEALKTLMVEKFASIRVKTRSFLKELNSYSNGYAKPRPNLEYNNTKKHQSMTKLIIQVSFS